MQHCAFAVITAICGEVKHDTEERELTDNSIYLCLTLTADEL